MLDNLISKIKSLSNFSQSDVDLFTGSLEERCIKKGEHILEEGQICRHLFYIQTGLMMVYKNNDGIEIPYCFMAENEWIGLMKSFNEKIPSDKAIKALEDTKLFRLSADKLEQLFKLQPKFLILKNDYLEHTLMEVARHSADLRLLDAKNKYFKFRENNPTLINRIPQYYIAAYLGVKPQSISRIRKEG
ncbi:Crp/Fnr family transcriptional regulator [Chryseobacterium sp. MEBOG06]|uniref:Crp/Fnr family transcriptional regulator n=1 Tax=unclassified Chryseobacterium TaxID=2593645 RepID=UPI001F368584|nr:MULTISPECIES: Crp/Fnr family transcriptional regulator [unclassified Chryseobacterium]UKB84866.1 Crp/Fnr family transcriptional regulator [Chryseobacterium sp. MEBOG06]